jgi:TonB-linked SusC/RagA family outer membrane protein
MKSNQMFLLKKSWHVRFLFLFLYFFITLASYAQVKISGKVTDRKGEFLIGVNVTIKDLDIGTVTDFEGNFSLNAPNENSLIEFSYVGFKTQEISLSGRNYLTVMMEEDIELLDEVVVVGYGVQKRVSITGSVSTINSDKLVTAPVASSSNALAGRVPGLITKQISGLPGSDGAELSIRGFNTPPLIIIDGAEGNINTIDVNEIESISTLKDAAAAIYGIRASGGVLLVTTKRGVSGKPSLTLNSSLAFQGPTKIMKMTSSGQYAEMVREENLRLGRPERFSEEDVLKYYAGNDPNYPNTDWVSYLTRKSAPMQQHNLSISGGSEKIKYYGFLGYLEQQSIIKRGGGQYKRYNIRSNTEANIFNNLVMNIIVSGIFEERNFPWRGDEGNDSMWQDMWNTEPIYPSTLPDTDKIPFADGGGTGGAHITSNRNMGGMRDSYNQQYQFNGSLRYDFNFLKGLSSKAMYTYQKSYGKYKNFIAVPDTYTYNYATDTYTQMAAGINPQLYQGADDASYLNTQLSLNYNKTFDQHHEFSGLLLFETTENFSNWLNASGMGFDNNTLPYLGAADPAQIGASGLDAEMGRVGFISRINYNYKSKYLIELAFRSDASAKFDKEHRWGLFPSMSFGWRIAEESFIKDNYHKISNIKLRLSYSQTGNENLRNNFNYLSTYNYAYPYVFGNIAKFGLLGTFPNPLLSWETMTIYNTGIDFGFFKNRLHGELDFFYRDRDGIPATRQNALPDTFGARMPEENLNRTGTRGFDLSIGFSEQSGNFKYDISGNLTWSRTKWIHFDEPEFTDPDDIRIRKKTGHWVDRTLGYKSDGLFTSKDQISNLNFIYDLDKGNSLLAPGDIRYINTNDDDRLDWRDQVEVGKGTMPNWYYGLNFDINYRQFDLSAVFQGAFDFTHRVVLRQWKVFPEIMYNERWTEQNNDAKAIVARLGGAPSNGLNSDFNHVNGDYLRLKNLSIGYSFPRKWMSKIGFNNARIYASGTNIFTISKLWKYSIDPEAASGMGGYYYPQIRSFSAGLTLTF